MGIEHYSKEQQPGQIEISPARPDDVPQIQEVFYQTWLSTYPNEEHGITVDDIKDRYQDRHSPEKTEARMRMLEHPPEGQMRLVARKEGRVVGLAFASRSEGRNQLNAIYILPELQGKGVGRGLWEELQNFFDPAADTYVEVATYNTSAIAFYKSLGFEDTGRRMQDERFRFKSGSIIPEMEMVRHAGATSPSDSEARPKA